MSSWRTPCCLRKLLLDLWLVRVAWLPGLLDFPDTLGKLLHLHFLQASGQDLLALSVIEVILLLQVAAVFLIAEEPSLVPNIRSTWRDEHVFVDYFELSGQSHFCLGLQVPHCVFANGGVIWIGSACFEWCSPIPRHLARGTASHG